MDIWEKLYNEALQVQNARVISPFIEAGGVAAALLTKAGNIYVGVCIDTASTLGMCAERNAIANMITNGEHEIDKLVAIVEDGSVGSPFFACLPRQPRYGRSRSERESLPVSSDVGVLRTARLDSRQCENRRSAKTLTGRRIPEHRLHDGENFG